MIIALFFGISLNFGILFPVLMDYFQETRERTAWVGSVGVACTFALGPLTSILVNRFGCRPTAMLGSLTCVGSLLLSSLPSTITIMYITYSILFGFGSSCLFVSSYVVASQYFDKKRSIATGIIASGTGIGVFAVAPILQALLDAYDWRVTYRVTAGIFSVVCFLCLTFDPAVLQKEENKKKEEELTEKAAGTERQPQNWLNFSIFKEKVFVVVTLSFTMAELGHHTPRLHLVKFSEDLGVSADAASKLFMYIGITTFIGRLLSGFLSNMRRVNPVYVFMFGLILDGSSVVFLSQATNYGHLIAFSFLYGMADGFVIGTFNIIILYCVEPSKRASAVGVSSLFYGITTAAGPPLAGFMTDRLNTYIPSFFLAAIAEFVGAALLLILVCDRKQRQSRELVETVEVGEQSELIDAEVWITNV